MLFNYNGHSQKPGIYEIVNVRTNIRYIGSAREFKERWRGHMCSLRNRKHGNKHLLNSFLSHLTIEENDDFLEFHVLEVMLGSTKEERLSKEEIWIEQRLSEGLRLYNQQLKPTLEPKERSSKQISSARLDKTYEEIFGTENASLIKEKQVSSRLKFFNEHPEFVEKLRKANSGSSNPFFGKAHTDETRKKISDLQTGLTYEQRFGAEKAKEKKARLSALTIKRLKEDPRLKDVLGDSIRGKTLEEVYGSARAQEIKNKRAKGIAKKYAGFCLVDPLGNEYVEIANMLAFCREHGLDSAHLRSLIIGKLKTHKGWKLTTQNRL